MTAAARPHGIRSLSEVFGETPEPIAPAMMSVCPADNPRPRDLPQFQDAARAAEGDDVKEIDACEAFEGMTLWCPVSKSWFTVKSVQNTPAKNSIYGHVPAQTTICIFDPSPFAARWWVVDPDRAVVQRAPAPARTLIAARPLIGLPLPDNP